MPCFCWMGDEEITEEMKIIRQHMEAILVQMRIIHGKGDLYPSKNSAPLPRVILEDVHKLLNDLWIGKCEEKP